ncbi:MAG: hypothetical protein Kow009_11690 [Spirochaetales bacterium]
MHSDRMEPVVFMPTSLSEALSLKEKHPDTMVFAGGTYHLWNQSSRSLQLPSSILSLRNVKELTRLGRTETRLDIGAIVPFQRILRAGAKVISPILAAALEDVCPPSVTSMATLGGNLAVPDRCMASFPVMHVLDARCEIRSLRKTRWVPVTSLRSSTGEPQIRPNELITRIQIPMEEWNFFIHRRIGSFPYGITPDALILALVGKTYRGMLTEFRFALGNFSSSIYRNRDLETLLIGAHLPLSKSKDLNTFLQRVEEDLDTQSFLASKVQRERVIHILRSALADPFQYSG